MPELKLHLWVRVLFSELISSLLLGLFIPQLVSSHAVIITIISSHLLNDLGEYLQRIGLGNLIKDKILEVV